MKVVLYGATGKVGSIILKELVDRGHSCHRCSANSREGAKNSRTSALVQDDLSDPAKDR